METIKQVRPEEIIGPLKSSSIIRRHSLNPIFTSRDVPYPSVITYNAGVVKYQGRYVMIFRNDYNWNEEAQKAIGFQIGVAYSDNGISNWRLRPQPILEFEGDEDVRGSMDPRITLLDGRLYITYAQITGHGYRGTIAVTDDFERIEIVTRTVPDNRNIVLFPERINNRYLRHERPFPIDSRSQRLYDIWISESPDLVYWGNSEPLLCVEDVPYANERLGAGSPPVRTEQGWLSIFHAGGLILEENGEVKIYYGAADTFQCLATTQLDDLLDFCLSFR